jgi:transposase-like protein
METAFPRTLLEAIIYFADPDRALDFVARLRWPNGQPTCPECSNTAVSFLRTRRLWKCKGCKKQFSVKRRTIFEDSAIGLDKWLAATWVVCNCKNGISSYEIARDLGVTQKTAWFMLHRIRVAMDDQTFEKKMSGEVESDETFIGGKAKNMHLIEKIRRQVKGDLAQGGTVGKAIVMGLLERNSRKVRARVLPELKKAHTDEHVRKNVVEGSTLYTDSAAHYENLPDYAREFVDHTETYVRGAVHVNGVENFWSLLKRSLAGTYVSVEPFHLQAYVNEQAFRYNNREFTDFERFSMTVAQIAGRRLTYDELTGKNLESSERP